MTFASRFHSLLAVCALTLAGCASAPGLKSARILPEGEHEFFAAIGTAGGSRVPEFIGGARGTPWKNFELEGRLAPLGLSGFEGRYQFLANEKWAATIGASLFAGGMSFDSKVKDPITGEDTETDSPSAESNFVMDLGIPLYVGYDIDDELSFYFSPRLVTRGRRDGLPQTLDTRAQFLFGAQFAGKAGLILEAGPEYSSRDHTWIGRFAVGISWK